MTLKQIVAYSAEIKQILEREYPIKINVTVDPIKDNKQVIRFECEPTDTRISKGTFVSAYSPQKAKHVTPQTLLKETKDIFYAGFWEFRPSDWNFG